MKSDYRTFEYQVNTYVLFYEVGINILKQGGLLGYITPATYSTQYYYKNLRNLIQQYTIVTLSRYNYEVFPDANIGDTISIVIDKNDNRRKKITVSLCKAENDSNDYIVDYDDFIQSDGTYNFNFGNLNFNKYSVETIPLEQISNVIVGIKAYQTGKGEPKQTKEIVEGKIFTADYKKDATYIQCVNGKDFYRYTFLTEPSMFLSYGKWLAEPRETAPFFDDEKIIIRQTADCIIATIDNERRINLNNVYNVGLLNKQYSLKYLLVILNSKLMKYLYQNRVQENGRVFPEVKKVILGQIPIKAIDLPDQQPFIALADKMLDLHKTLQEKKSRFLRRISETYNLEKITQNLEIFYDLDFKAFNSELAKQKIKLSLVQKDELEDYFAVYKTECLSIKTEIENTDKEIDKIVYELYGLSEEDVKVVEGK